MVFSIVIGWPVVGFMIGSVTGDPTAWRADRQVVRLCQRLTWLLVAPCLVRLLVQGPIYLAAKNDTIDPGGAVAALGTAKLLMGWPLQVAALAGMVWLLSRNTTPVQESEEPA